MHPSGIALWLCVLGLHGREGGPSRRVRGARAKNSKTPPLADTGVMLSLVFDCFYYSSLVLFSYKWVAVLGRI